MTKPTIKAKPAPSWKSIGFKALGLLLYPFAIWMSWYMKDRPELVESFFSQGIYPGISSFIGGIFSIFPFSFAEFLVYFIVAFVIIFPVICIVKGVRKKLSLRRFVSWLLTIAIIGGIGFNAFYWMWGFNYYRYPLAVGQAWTPRRIRRKILYHCALH